MTYSVGCLYVLVVQLSDVCIELSVAFVVLYVAVVVLSVVVVVLSVVLVVLSVVVVVLSVVLVVLSVVVVVLSFVVVYPVTFLQVCLHYLQLEKQLMWSFCLNSHLHTSGLQEKFPQMPSC